MSHTPDTEFVDVTYHTMKFKGSQPFTLMTCDDEIEGERLATFVIHEGDHEPKIAPVPIEFIIDSDKLSALREELKTLGYSLIYTSEQMARL